MISKINYSEELYSFEKYMGVQIFTEYDGYKYYCKGYSNGSCLYEEEGYIHDKLITKIRQQIAEDLVYD